MSLQKICLILACIAGGLWALGLAAGLVAAFPFGLPVLAGLGVLAFVFVRVVRDRLNNAEDDYYEKNIDK
jgi:hypothetical protein